MTLLNQQHISLFEQRMKLTKGSCEYKSRQERKFLIHRENVRRLKLLQSLLKMRLMSMPLMTYFHRLWLIRKGQYQLLEAMGQTLREPYEAIESINKEGVKIVYQGGSGAYTQEAACNFFGEDCDNYGVPTERRYGSS